VKAIITGASGFVGRVLARRFPSGIALPLAGGDWRGALAGADFSAATVFHLAARAHRGDDPEILLMQDNVDKTVALAEAAASRGASRLVFLSSIKVNGEETGERAFQARDREAPADAYASSKWAAERALGEIAARHGLEVVIVRAPLVIGDGARGNLQALMRIADTPYPLPFAALDNRRTFVHVEDLASLLVAAAASSQAPGRVFLAGHPDAVSTARLVRVMRQAFERPARLVRVSARALEALASIAGEEAGMRRLTRSLEVDAGDARQALGWVAAIPMDDGISAMARAFRAARDAS